MRPVVPFAEFFVVFLCLPLTTAPRVAPYHPITNTIAYPNQHERLPNAAKVTTFQFYRFYIARVCMFVIVCQCLQEGVCIYICVCVYK